jgi:hypothetical protein
LLLYFLHYLDTRENPFWHPPTHLLLPQLFLQHDEARLQIITLLAGCIGLDPAVHRRQGWHVST